MKLYVARDKDKSLYLYEYEPKKYKTIWNEFLGFVKELDSNWFPEVKWEDKEPTKVELAIKKKYESTRINRATKDTR